MEIVWLGHSAVRVVSSGATLITDPYSESLGLSLGSHTADIVTVSNGHPHHSSGEVIEGEPRILNGPGSYEIGSFYITGMATRLDASQGDRLVNTVFSMRSEGLTLCHLGDLNQRLSPGQVQELAQTDVLFVPAGETCTVGVAYVSELVNLIGPRILIPIHYRIEGVRADLASLDRFIAEMGITEVAPQARLNVTSTNLPRELRVVVLQREM